MAKSKRCRKIGCNEPPWQYTTHRMCFEHDLEADEAAQAAHLESPVGQAEAKLAECESVDDLKMFMRDHLLPLLPGA
jgi:hypothetical protein